MVRPRPEAGDGLLITTDIHKADVDRFRNLVERHLGLRFGDDAVHHLERVLIRRMEAARQTAVEYLDRIERNPHSEIPFLATALTTGETYFLRHTEQFHALVRTVAPERLTALRPTGRNGLRLLSAGCASGEEAYSLAIALRESAASPAETSVLGVDVNPAALEKAHLGRYSSWSMRGTVPAGVRRACFTTEGEEEVVVPELRAQVRFERRNFTTDDAALWEPGRYDIVFCRNVLMYFGTELMTEVIGRIARALAPGGYLFLGSAETLRGISDDFELCQSDGAFYYRKRAGAGSAPDQAGPPAAMTPAWARPRPVPVAAPVPELPPAPRPDLSPVLDLFARERFAEALAVLDIALGSVNQAQAGPDTLVVRAALQIQVRDRRGAEHTCYRLMASPAAGPTTIAAAQLLLSMCAEDAKDPATAIEYCRAALTSEPGHALARLHLARLLFRSGPAAVARVEYAEAARRLTTAADLEVLLFGGGFDRAALISLCEAQAVVP